jgi:hypothetical protein
MEKYIDQSMKEVCEELEVQQKWEDEQFMREMDEALGFNESKEVYVCCGCKDGWCDGCVPDETLL